MLRSHLIVAGLLAAQCCASYTAAAQEVSDSTIAIPSEWSAYYVVLRRAGAADALPDDSVQAP